MTHFLDTLKPAQRLDLPHPPGSGDAYLLAQLLQAGQKQMLTVITADAADAQRLLEEIPWLIQNEVSDLRIRLLPDWETLPYDHFSPHHDLISERLATLWEVWQGRCDLLLVPATTAVYRLLPMEFLAAYTFHFVEKQKLDTDKLREQLICGGYYHVSQVMSPGEYSVRGGLIDLFPMGSALPYRLDLFDEDLESIKAFDVDTQRTLYPVSELRLLPAREFPMDEAGRTCFRQKFREIFEGNPTKVSLYKDISNGISAAGVEYYLPLFFEKTQTLFDYLPDSSTVLMHGDVPKALSDFWRDTDSRYNMLFGDKTRPLLPPSELFLKEEDFFVALQHYGRYVLKHDAHDSKFPIQMPPDVSVDRYLEDPWLAFKKFKDDFSGRILVVAESAGRCETLQQTFKEHELEVKSYENLHEFMQGDAVLSICVGPLHAGFVWNPVEDTKSSVAFITETEFYSGTVRRTRRGSRKAANPDGWLRDLTELKVGDPIVHEAHGIGRYQGLVRMDLGEGELEFLEVHYANAAKLFVPVSQLQVIGRYFGADPDVVPLHILGSGQWEKAKKKAAMQAKDTAAELLQLYALRSARAGHAFEFSSQDYERFADGFEFEETEDQSTAIETVIADMRDEKPMDRLVCGDVGFGKTEVALRAAFCAVLGGKQVAVLCPTTLLCEQHFQTFSDRFASWPVRIEELSRFKTAKEIARVQKDMESGNVDIVIGTHRLIQKDVRFSRLGLIVIDEEHRFGVRQKEMLKSLRAQVDVLTLTATPIPRSLAMSMEGLRDFSIIATAPRKRLAIKTFIAQFSDSMIREAVLRELKRGGQVYFLHNEVSSIENMRDRLEKLLPEARIAVGHGQMHERELERTMRDFVGQRTNLLLCTTIIETGIDNPHANTILINRAEKFGLAQLHQLRGRVGRSHHQAYAYLLVQDDFEGIHSVKKRARKRLEAIAHTEELGAGFYLAMHDLEIRGAGEVLGDNQSGEIQEVGFSVYTDMLNRAVSSLKQGKEIIESDLSGPLDMGIEINLHIPALLPDNYCPGVHERLTLYKRLSNCTCDEELKALREELVDRFGSLPPQGEALLATHRIRLLVGPLKIKKLDATAEQVSVQFAKIEELPIDFEKLMKLIQHNSNYKLARQDKLSFFCYSPNLDAKIRAIRELLSAFTVD